MCLIVHTMKLLLLSCVLASASAAVSTDFNATSNFVQVIRRGNKVIHYTPPVFYYDVGFEEETIKHAVMRCLVEDPDNCEVFQQDDGPYYHHILVYMEYVFLGKGDGIARCDSNRKQSCSYILKTDVHVLSLTAGGEHLYAGLKNGSILRCNLQKPYSCRLLHTFTNRQVWSVTLMTNFLYAGLDNGALMRCLVTAENSCILRHALVSNITGLTVTGNIISALTWGQRLYSCIGEPSSGVCMSDPIKLNILYPRALASFNGSLYVINKQRENGIYICDMSNQKCRNFGRHKTYMSIAFAYGTNHMQSHFKNEDTACSWQSNSLCPPFVTYYDVQQRAELEVHVLNGRLYNSEGCLVTTSESMPAIFVMGPDGRLLLANNEQGSLYTSSLLAGNPVSGAGQIVVEKGVIKKIYTCSVHYQPDFTLNKQVVDSLSAQGYINFPKLIVSEKCCEGDTCRVDEVVELD